MKAAGAPTRGERRQRNFDLLDAIDLETDHVIALSDMVNEICVSKTDTANEEAFFAGFAVLADVIKGKMEAIQAKADELRQTAA